ncbi:hypothetical protein [Actinopolyspora halophila]|uniref:hypothetical protein n=1 Tax=Actinopolyspora halophila TaxID=1850 RepID=UPI000382E675|nr:hypothetical protein [Actinopolyspora halophila]
MALVNERVAEGVETLVARQGYSLADGRDEISAAEAESERSREEIERESADRKQRVLEQSRQAVADAEKDKDSGPWGAESGKSSNELRIGVVEEDEEYSAEHLSGGSERTPAPAAPPPAQPPAAPAPPRRRRSSEDDWDDEEDFSQRSWLQ